MNTPKPRNTVDKAAERLREIVLAEEQGAFIGREDSLISLLECSQSTVRQAARLLEREGLLKVRRGINGGYFGARPDAGTIEATVGTYLSRLDIDPQDVTLLASALWVEAMRKAASTEAESMQSIVAKLRKRLKSVKDDATFNAVRDVELETQAAIFDLTGSQYVKLIFDINTEFAKRRFTTPVRRDEGDDHLEFVRTWREAKLMELAAISQRDCELAVMAARYSRKVWLGRVYASDLTANESE